MAARRGTDPVAGLSVTLRATQDSPVVNPALLIRNWGSSKPRIEIDGRPVSQGRNIRAGYIHGLESDDLVLWLRLESTSSVRIATAPTDGSN